MIDRLISIGLRLVLCRSPLELCPLFFLFSEVLLPLFHLFRLVWHRRESGIVPYKYGGTLVNRLVECIMCTFFFLSCQIYVSKLRLVFPS